MQQPPLQPLYLHVIKSTLARHRPAGFAAVKKTGTIAQIIFNLRYSTLKDPTTAQIMVNFRYSTLAAFSGSGGGRRGGDGDKVLRVEREGEAGDQGRPHHTRRRRVPRQGELPLPLVYHSI